MTIFREAKSCREFEIEAALNAVPDMLEIARPMIPKMAEATMTSTRLKPELGSKQPILLPEDNEGFIFSREEFVSRFIDLPLKIKGAMYPHRNDTPKALTSSFSNFF
jgi:hypothetical protein